MMQELSLECAEIVELSTTIDDMTPEALAFACQQLMEAGALDVYTTPVTMKKGRQGFLLTAVCHPADEKKMAHQILLHTTTNGLRAKTCRKYALPCRNLTVNTPWGEVRIKTAEAGGVRHIKPEYEDIIRIAKKEGIPFCEVSNIIYKML